MKSSYFFSVFAAVLFGFFFTANSHADGITEPIPSFYQEPGMSPNRQYVNQHANEHIDTFTGKLQLHYVDLFIPGNGGMDLKVQRSYTSQGEEFPSNSASGIGWTMHYGRVLRSASTDLCDFTAPASKNPVLELPDGSRQIMYVALDNASYITSNFWKATCSGGGYAVLSPDGTRYDMNILNNLTEGDTLHPVNAYHTSKITDRNGNVMSFTYTTTVVSGGVSFGVQTVSTGDGRAVRFHYDENGMLHSLTNSDQTVTYMTYSYEASTTMAYRFYLTEAKRADGTSWKYQYNLTPIGTAGSASIAKMTYPTGGTIDYNYDFVNYAAVALPRSTVISKKVAGDGTWTYSYKPATQALDSVSENVGPTMPQFPPYSFILDPDNSAQLDQTTIQGPDGTRVYSHIGYTSIPIGGVFNIGLLAFTKIGSIQMEGNNWSGTLISLQPNRRADGLTYDLAIYAPIATGRTTNRNGQEYSVSYGNMDIYGNPGTITETGTATKTTTVSYLVDTNKWILHTKKDETSTLNNPGGGDEPIGTITRDFDARHNLTSENRYGVATNFTYTAEGDLESRTDARNNTVYYKQYKRGIAQREEHPEGVLITRVVSDAGNVMSQTDGELAATDYGYDDLNRLTSVTHPVGNPVTIVWGVNTRTTQRGNYTEVVTFDGFGREAEVRHTDAATGSAVLQSHAYDPLGRRIFTSYPNAAIGTGYVYDPLGRVQLIGHGSDRDVHFASSWRSYYYASNTVKLTNERTQDL